MPHRFSVPHCSWSNATVQHLGKNVSCLFQSIYSGLQMNAPKLSDSLPLVQTDLHKSLSPKRLNLAPVPAFMGLRPPPQAFTFLSSETFTPATLSKIQQKSSFNTNQLWQAIFELLSFTNFTLTKSRALRRLSQEMGALIDYSVGGWVLVAKNHFSAEEKVLLRWRGSQSVTTATNNYVYKVKDICSNKMEEIHHSGLKFCSYDELEQKVLLSHIV